MPLVHVDSKKMQLVHVGSDMMVDMNRAVAIAGNLSVAPTQRLIEKARDRKMLVDMTAGLKPKSAIITNDGRVILVHLLSWTIVGRLNNPLKEMEVPEENKEGVPASQRTNYVLGNFQLM